MKNVFSRTFTNFSTLFTPPALRKRARVEEPGEAATELPAHKAARTVSRPASAGDNTAPNGFARELESVASDLPVSRPAISPLGALPLGQSDHKRAASPQQHKQQLQSQIATNHEPCPQLYHTPASQPSSRQAAVKGPSPLSKVTYAAGTPSAFGSNFSVEGSGHRLLQDEPGSCWAGSKSARATIGTNRSPKVAPSRVCARQYQAVHVSGGCIARLHSLSPMQKPKHACRSS